MTDEEDHQPEIEARELVRLDLSPSARRSAEDFLESFDISTVPTGPGCYIMHDETGRVIYVGKAKNLRARIRTYITDRDSRYSVKFLMRRVADIDFLVVHTDKEAFLLENSLIKKHKPRYNVRLKDDKTYLSLRLNVKEDFPRLQVVRRYRKDGARYFGPYVSAAAARQTLRQLNRLFPLRKCSDNVMNNRARPCLYHQMKQCLAPCVGLADKEQYKEIERQVIMVIEGRSDELDRMLRQRIGQHADRLEFEEAAELRDRLYALQKTVERQRAVSTPWAADRDVFGLYNKGRYTEIQVLYFRKGKMIGGASYSFKRREMPTDELLSSFLLQYYRSAPVIPEEVLVPEELEAPDVLAELLSEERGAKVTVHCPQRGEKRRLIEMAAENARTSFDEKQLAERAQADVLEEVRATLQLSRTPHRIECFDISTTQGDKPVGAMVVFEAGSPSKARYRRFAIKKVEGQDDFAMLREVLLRRYTRAIEEDDLPDLVLIDGGKGQLNVAVSVLKDLGIEDVDVASIAKARHLADDRDSPERLFRPGRKNPIVPHQNGPVVQLLARVRDETHRFAITYHRKRRSKGVIRTGLTRIDGVGERRAKKLLTKFGSIARIQAATVDEIAAVPGVSRELARTILEQLGGSPTEQTGQKS